MWQCSPEYRVSAKNRATAGARAKRKIGKQAEVQKNCSDGSAADSPQRHINETIMALSELGYKPRDAQVAIEKVVKARRKNALSKKLFVNALRGIVGLFGNNR